MIPPNPCLGPDDGESAVSWPLAISPIAPSGMSAAPEALPRGGPACAITFAPLVVTITGCTVRRTSGTAGSGRPGRSPVRCLSFHL
ncbi:MAG: hypothetical protein WCJ30_18635 [Deltaproteobacteria bacterium]